MADTPPRRRLPGGTVPPRRPPVPPGAAPFDRRDRPLGMIHETWLTTEEPGRLKDGAESGGEVARARDDSRHQERLGPALAVWIIIAVVVAIVILAVVSYRRAPP